MKRYNKVMVCVIFLLASTLIGCSQKGHENTSNVTSAIITSETLQTTQSTENVNLLPRQTEDYHGGWSLYDGEKMADWPQIGNGEANQVAYSLFCLKEVVFENGSVWSNPEYDNFFQTYAGKQIDIDTLQDYYPYTYNLKVDKDL